MATKVRRREWITVVGLSTFLFATWSEAGEVKYQKPPRAVLDVFNVPPFPVALSNPTGDALLLVRPVRYPPIAQLAKPMLRLAGLRIDPPTNGEHNSLSWSDLSPRKIADDSEVKMELPPGSRPNYFHGSADGKWLTFPNTGPNGIEPWIADAHNGPLRRCKFLNISRLQHER